MRLVENAFAFHSKISERKRGDVFRPYIVCVYASQRSCKFIPLADRPTNRTHLRTKFTLFFFGSILSFAVFNLFECFFPGCKGTMHLRNINPLEMTVRNFYIPFSEFMIIAAKTKCVFGFSLFIHSFIHFILSSFFVHFETAMILYNQMEYRVHSHIICINISFIIWYCIAKIDSRNF